MIAFPVRARWRRALVLGALGALGVLGAPLAPLASAGAQRTGGPPRPQDPLRFQLMGPATGGRIAAVVGVPGDPTTYYFGAASGGIFKSTDGGLTTVPIFDSQPVQAIGALALAPSDHNTVWAGTGEAWVIRDADVMGDGVYKSTDAGRTWTNMGLRETGRIGRIIVHPTNKNIVYVCALGRTTGPQEERGVYRTLDGGATWQRVLFAGPNTGCSGLAMDSRDPSTLFAGTWEVVMHTWAMFSGGPGSALYVTHDGGATWTKLSGPGLPRPPVGKIDVAIAPSDSKRVYALIQTPDQGSLWRSDDGGSTWRVASWDRSLIGRAGYYIRLAVNPANANEVLVASSSFHRSTDGGLTFPFTDRGCGDCHDIWMDPTNPDRWVTTGDANAGITTNHARSFSTVSLPIGQMYHVAVDNQVPYWIYSNRQDNGTMRGPSDVPEQGIATGGRGERGRGTPDTTSAAAGRGRLPGDSLRRAPGDTTRRAADSAATAAGAFFNEGGFGGGSTWDHGIGGCESGFTIPDWADPNIVWATCYGNEVTRYDARVKRARSVSPWRHTLDSPPNALKYRCHWTPPLAIDPFDHTTVYYGCQVVFKTTNGGQSWSVISPDLSTQDPTRIVSSGGVVGDNLGQFYGEVVFAIAPSEIQRGLIWAGTNDGKLWYTRDGGTHWVDVTSNVGMKPWGTVRKIEPSHFDPATAYVAVDYHIMDDRAPYIYKTTDYGQTWTRVTGDLPVGHPLDYVMAVTENPNRRGMLFAGTGHGFYYSVDDGAHWTQLKDGLPAAPVTWVVVPKTWHDVVVSTYGRGLYILHDITPLEQGFVRDAPVAAARLFAPRPAFRLARGGSAPIDFALPSAPADSVVVEVLDARGAVIRTIKTMARAGLNRVSWDLREDGPKQVELRTTPPDNPHIWDEPRFKGKTTRPITHWGLQAPQRLGPLVLPGRYAVRLVGAATPPPQPLEVRRDPAIQTTAADLAASTRTQRRIRDDIDATATMVNRIEAIRRQVEDQLRANAGKGDVAAALRDIDRKMLDVELRLVSRSDLHSDDKWFVESYKLYQNLVWLNGVVGSGAGDVAGGAEYRPTDSALAVLAALEQELAAATVAYRRLMEVDVPAFNKAVAGGGVTITMP